MRPRFMPEAFGKIGSSAYEVMKEILTILRGRVNLHDNVQLLDGEYTFAKTFGAVADTETTLDISALNLAWIPTYIITIDSDNGGFVYASSKGSWTATTIKAKCTKASTNAIIALL